MPDVSCTVNTCKHYVSGNKCEARRIIIQSDSGSGVSQGADLGSLSETPANKKDETCCQTFNNMK